MRGTTLEMMEQMLRRELRVAESPALSKNVSPSYQHALRSAQERLFQGHDWPFKIIDRDITVWAGARYYAPPANMDLENLRDDVKFYYNGQWYDVRRGIGPEDYNVFNSATGIRSDPVRAWNIYNDPTTNGDMIEVWPIPASNGGTVRFRGPRKLSPLVSSSDKADLDDLLIVLTAAADLCPIKEVQRAEAKAERHLFSLMRNLADGKTFVSGGGSNPRDQAMRPPQIVIAATTG